MSMVYHSHQLDVLRRKHNVFVGSCMVIRSCICIVSVLLHETFGSHLNTKNSLHTDLFVLDKELFFISSNILLLLMHIEMDASCPTLMNTVWITFVTKNVCMKEYLSSFTSHHL